MKETAKHSQVAENPLVVDNRRIFMNKKHPLIPVRPNTDASSDGGLGRSSDEVPIMEMERRTEVVQLELPLTTSDSRGMDKAASTKSIPITKQMVWEAYKHVRGNHGTAGIDNETIERYEERLSDNLYILWNHMSSGCYVPPTDFCSQCR